MASAPDATTVRSLRLQRRGYRSQLRELIDTIPNLLQQIPVDSEILQGHLSTFDYQITKIQEIDHDMMPVLKEAEIEPYLKESNDLFTEIRVTTARMRRAIVSTTIDDRGSENLSRRSTETAIHTPIALPPTHVQKQFPRLPQLELPKFNGDPLHWNTFWDSYESAIHSTHMPSVDKFNYLNSLLRDVAADALSGISICNSYYDTAITIIKERFGQNQTIINAHVESLMNIPKASSETAHLRKLLDSMEVHVRGLDTLGITAAANGSLLRPIILSKLPPDLRLILTRTHGSAVGDLQILRDLLKTEIQARELSQDNNQSSHASAMAPEYSTGALLLPTRETRCVFCKGNHNSVSCRTFQTPSSRKTKLLQERRCFNCLHQGHTIKYCPSTQLCRCCEQRHHTAICQESSQAGQFRSSDQSRSTGNSRQATQGHRQAHAFQRSHQRNSFPNRDNRHRTQAHAVFNNDVNFAAAPAPDEETVHTSLPTPALLSTSGSILMQTALTKVRDQNGNYEIVRLLFDTGSQKSYISARTVKLLGLKPNAAESLSIAPFGHEGTTTKTYDLTTIVCHSLVNTDSHAIDAVIVPMISQPVYRTALTQALRSTVSRLPLADPPSSTQSESLEIDVLVGLDHYWDIVDDENVRLPNSKLTATPSAFGYLLSGKTNQKSSTTSYSALTVGVVAPTSEDFLKRFWECESFDVSKAHIHDTLESDPVLVDFENTIIKRDDRYEVRLPWKQETPDLPTNFALASDRFHGLVQRLLKKKYLMKDYDNIIKQQLASNFIEPVDPSQPSDGLIHYIAHHPVVKPERATTKVRIVYDASAKITAQHNSLNDCLHPGPNLLNDIQRLLLEFRTFEIAVIADIEKAFLQVGLSIADRDATRFFWLKDINRPADHDNIQIYRFARVPFGATSSPFLLAATLNHHFKLSSNPIVTSLSSQLYVDNMIVGVTSVSQAKELYLNAKQCIREAGMNLREWTSNCSEFLDSLPPEDKAKGTASNVLGVQWNTENDHISCKSIYDSIEPERTTKRRILRVISKVYDPLGLLSPVVIKAKILMQDLWKDGLDWDKPTSPALSNKWNKIVEQFRHFSTIAIPRHISITPKSNVNVFVDASLQAYGVAAYVRFVDVSGISSRLLCSKSRVAPIKKVTIPRLEFIAAVMGCQLAAFILKSIPSLNKTVHIWSDSQIVLHWIKNSNHKLEIFVKNRVDLIQTFGYNFSYCPTAENPADLCTCGISTADLKDNRLWWQGPTWLTSPQIQWPQTSMDTRVDESTPSVPVLKTQPVLLPEPSPFDIDVHRFNSLNKLLGVTSYCNRFVNRLRHKELISSSRPTAEELDASRIMWIKATQRQFFRDEFRLLDLGSTNQRIKELHLFNADGILRCHGRFQHANIQASSLNPILLPKHHYFTDLVIMQHHTSLLHQGVRHTTTSLRQEFWIPNARQQVKSVLRKCRICRHWNGPSFPSPPLPPLPGSRLTQSPPFSYTGCDYAGPIYVYDQGTPTKAYICLFTCAVTRALHLELVGDMTTGTFILALKRFFSRRGVPTMIISDNAKTFKLASTIMERLWLDVLVNPETVCYIAQRAVKWRFNVERAPWWGGFYERLVGLVKRTLVKASGKTRLSAIQLTTLLTEIEAILNLRPLTYVYTDSEAGEPLSPNSFLISSSPGMPSYIAGPDPSFKDVPADELLLKLEQHHKSLDYYWSIWHTEYLYQLREYHHMWQKKTKSCKQIPSVGDVVLVKEEGQKRGNWKLGLVQQLYHGTDGNIRSVTVKCKSGLLNRSVIHLYPLELNCTNVIHSTDPVPKDKDSNLPKRQAAQKATIAIKKQAALRAKARKKNAGEKVLLGLA